MTNIYLSVVVPCYNERENLLRGVLEEMHDYLSQQPYTVEVIVSDDGSTDDSREITASRIGNWPNFRLLENVHGGKPAAVWSGIQAAQGEIVLFTDMDQSTPIHQLAKLLPFFDQGYDVVIGSRGMGRENFPLYRRLGSNIFRGVRRLFLLHSVADTQCGFKAMRRAVACEAFPQLEAIRRASRPSGWKVTAFDVELLFLTEKLGHRLREVEVEWANRDVSKGKRKSYLAESQEMARELLRIKLNDWRGEYTKR